jgi:hypothetical protein
VQSKGGFVKRLVILTGIVFALFCSTSALGQWATHATVQVPFEFAVATIVLPAGTYAVLLNAQTHGVMLQNRDAQVSATAFSHDIYLIPSGVATSSKLIFASIGQRRVLHQVVIAGDNHMHDLIHGDEVAELTGKPAT